jgi:hypothetical protein
MTRVEVGQRYAYREPPVTWLKPLLPVEVLKLGPTPRSGKVRVRWLGGEWEGLDVWAPFAAARGLAQTLCRRHGREILEYLRDKEDALRQATVSGLYLPRHSRWRDPNIGPEYAAEWLRKDEPVFALVAAWCGECARREFDREGAFRVEIARLRELVADAAAFLEAHGHPKKARLIQQALTSGGSGEPEGGPG